MATITKIELQKNNKQRYSIFLDEKYAFGVNEDILLKHALRKGLVLTEAQISEIETEDQYKKAYLLAINYLSYRMRSEKEMRDYLYKKEVAPPWIHDIIQQLLEDKYLDDTAFTNMFIRDRMHQTSKGPLVIKRELKEKGVTQKVIDICITQYKIEDQIDKGLKWLEKEFKKKSSDAHHKRMEKLKIKLHQKGYTFDVIAQIFENFEPEVDKERELEKFTKQANKLYDRYSKKLEGYELHMKLKAMLYQKGFSGDLITEYIQGLKDE